MKTAVALFLLNIGLILCIEVPVGYNNTSRFKNPPERYANGACAIKLKPTVCDEDEVCGYQVNLPPLTIQLPKQSKLLKKTVKQVKSLTATVNKMKSRWLEEKQKKPIRHDQAIGSIEHGRGDANRITVLEKKITTLTGSLQQARNQIKALQGRLEKMSILNMDTVLHYINNEISNINYTVNTLNNKCYTTCAAVGQAVIQWVPQDCSDYYKVGHRKSGIYEIAKGANKSFSAYCDMKTLNGGWTVLQSRKDGSVNFNRTWVDYKNGFGNLSTEFWLGNDKIHLLTKSKDMVLRIEIEDWKGIQEYASYDHFFVADEDHYYQLTVNGYSGTAGDALHNIKNYDHDQKYFTTKDKDNDNYPLGNCGAYYSSGWWFDSCMSANLNGKYYKKLYKGIRNGIYWGTWHSVAREILNGYRHAFKSVRMLIRPKAFTS
ncbi:fibrinogen-like 2a [Carcharodon carcharias]|uniref:fibrinogen-like 2a n=1 Tax=Carcharodon carcharias TaxID=13397 RepID=UPI001B7E9B55|nr:fibrinogen-like 2a [Carcharodon carcharias]